VLAGLARTIARARPAIVIEMIASHLARVGATPQQVCRTIADHGYLGYLHQLSGASSDRRLSLVPIDPEHWRDGHALWLPMERSKSEPDSIRFGLNRIDSREAFVCRDFRVAR
jgi:hypothetical protein